MTHFNVLFKFIVGIPFVRFQPSKVSLDGMLQLGPGWRKICLLTHVVQHLDQTEESFTIMLACWVKVA